MLKLTGKKIFTILGSNILLISTYTILLYCRKKLESQKEEIEHLKKVLDSKEETEKKQSGTRIISR